MSYVIILYNISFNNLFFWGNFYMFLVSSNRFRRTVVDRLLWYRKRDQIVPFQQPTNQRSKLKKK